ncbi:transmembrane protein 19 [Drosophila grimshawi]|uniref:Transmembrane protein 19 n=1 Tax=Drosophila grimshawi TaxID=7222 RepID=B4J177_DROGR|nr:transmembrane protein 19 [Drosophila grimshawi]EDV97946.1 GH14423 [Drosophila grimshawi]
MANSDWMPLLFCGLSIPISLFMWLGNVAFSKFWRYDYEEPLVIPLTRWLFSTLAPLALMTVALRRHSVSKSGAALGVIVAFTLSIASHPFFGSLVVFFFSSSRATKFQAQSKRKFECDFKEGEGQRNWVQVLCNGGMAMQLALLYLLDCGSGERAIDFGKEYRSSWLGIAVMSSFACCNGDTWSSELGSVLSTRDPISIISWRRVPRGTNGGVSFIGVVVSLLGGLLVGFGYFVTVRYTVDAKMMLVSPPQWPIILFGGLSGLFGSLLDSVLGGMLQFSGINAQGKIVDAPGKGVRHVSGLRILDNHSVNLISSITIGVTMPLLALKFWPGR